MKKSDHCYSYKNLLPKENSSRPVVPVPGRMSTIDSKLDRASKELQMVNARRDTLPTNNSRQFHSSKENDPRYVNRQANVQTEPNNDIVNTKQRSREFKLYTEMDLEESKHKQRADKLELELQRKLSDSGFLGFFRTGNSSEFSHIDIYLELVKMENMLNDKNKGLFELEKKYSQAQREIQELLECREKSELKFRSHTEQIRKFTELIDRMQQKLEENEGNEKYNQLKILFDDLQKQRVATLKRIKEVEDQLASARKEREHQREDMQSEIHQLSESHKKEMHELNDTLAKKEIELGEVSQANNELRTRVEQLSNECESLTVSVRDLQEQLETDQTRSVETQLELQSLRETVKDLEEDNQDLKGRVNELQEIKTKLHSEVQKKNEYKNLVNDHMSKQKKLEEKLQLSKQELKKLESLMAQSEDCVTKLKAQLAAQKAIEKQLRESLTKYEYEAKMLLDDKKRQEDLIGRLESDLTKQTKTLENYQSEHDSNSMKLQSINEKRQSNERVKTVGRMKEACARLRLYLPEGFELPQIKENDELERTVCQLCHLVNSLMTEHLNPVRKQLESLTISLKTMELEKECIEESKQLELQGKEEAIRVLLKFVPEQSSKMVQEYLSVLESADCRSETIGRKVALLEGILKQADRSKNRRNMFHSEQSTKRSMGDSHRKTVADPTPAIVNNHSVPPPTGLKRDKSISRDLVARKYFE